MFRKIRIALVVVAGLYHCGSLDCAGYKERVISLKPSIILSLLIGSSYGYWIHRQNIKIRESNWILPIEVSNKSTGAVRNFLKEKDDELWVLENSARGKCMRHVSAGTAPAKPQEMSPYYQRLTSSASAVFKKRVPNYDPNYGINFSKCETYKESDFMRMAADHPASAEIVSHLDTERIKKAEDMSGLLIVGYSQAQILEIFDKAEEGSPDRDGYWKAKLNEYHKRRKGRLVLGDKISHY